MALHFLFFLSSLFWLPGISTSMAAPVVIERLQASVNSQIILLSDIRDFRRTLKLRAQIDPLFSGSPIAAKGGSVSDDEILEFIIHERLIAQLFPVSDGEVEQSIAEIQSTNRMDRSALKAALASEGFDFSDYYELIRSSTSKRTLIDREIKTKVTITDDDLKNEFLNSRSSNLPRVYVLKLISVTARNFKSPQAAQERLVQAVKEVRSGIQFEDVAKRVSDAPNASLGGDLGALSEDQLSPLYREQLKKLRVGEISDAFLTADRSAYQALKLVDIKTQDQDQFEKQRDEIRARLASREYQRQITLWLERQKQTAYIHRKGKPALEGLPVEP
jgi:peptidyl-prolyl cis-trans isomerase SurA